MHTKRSISGLLLLAIISLPFFLIVSLQARQQYVRKQMLKRLEREQLVTVEVNRDAIMWVHANKECLIGEELFDVKRIQHNGNRLLLTGLYDSKEKALKHSLAKHGGTTKESGTINQIYYFLSLLSLPHVLTDTIASCSLVVNVKKGEQPSFYRNPYYEFRDPPPEIG